LAATAEVKTNRFAIEQTVGVARCQPYPGSAVYPTSSKTQSRKTQEAVAKASTHLALVRNLGGLGSDSGHHAVPPRTVDVPHINL
jgi:hypothetical protein